jgi:hypothetical protein
MDIGPRLRIESGHCFRICEACGDSLEALGGRVIVGGKPAKTHEAGVDQLVVVVEFRKIWLLLLIPSFSTILPKGMLFDIRTGQGA